MATKSQEATPSKHDRKLIAAYNILQSERPVDSKAIDRVINSLNIGIIRRYRLRALFRKLRRNG